MDPHRAANHRVPSQLRNELLLATEVLSVCLGLAAAATNQRRAQRNSLAPAANEKPAGAGPGEVHKWSGFAALRRKREGQTASRERSLWLSARAAWTTLCIEETQCPWGYTTEGSPAFMFVQVALRAGTDDSRAREEERQQP
ncbi:hypothetical protein MHYP_G00276930 [Metynnis hypsauchen]